MKKDNDLDNELDKLIIENKIKAYFSVINIILFILMILILVCCPPTIDNEYQNVSSIITEKKIVYVHKYMDDGLHYYLFTEENVFDVDLKTYNSFNIGDSVIITKHEGSVYFENDGCLFYDWS